MEEFTKNGRKLRPRKSGSARREEGPAYSTANAAYKHEHQRGPRQEGRPYGERRNYGEGRSYGENRPYGEGRSNYQQRHGSRPGGESRNYGENRPYGEGRNSYGPKRSNAEGHAHGDRRQKSYSQPARGEDFKKGPAKFNQKRKPARPAGNEGIERMLKRKAVVSQAEYSDNDYVNIPVQEEVRLNKFIANSGVCSRREADTLIQAGVVTVNGEVVTELGTKVNIYKDEIKFNGEHLKGEEKVYLIMNKPKGYVTTASDPHAEKTVMDLLKGCQFRVFPVGRLDKNTTGVLMFTNDGELAERLTHPSYNKKKIYQVNLNRPLEQEDYDKIMAGVELSDGLIAADELEYIDANDHRKLGIEIHSGKNRIVRRIFEALGYEVRALDRVYFAGLTKKGLKKGHWRQLSEGEVNILKMGAYV
ncbi:MAG: pseudouridine synthase [Candidatus Cryptobacteroides sp.]